MRADLKVDLPTYSPELAICSTHITVHHNNFVDCLIGRSMAADTQSNNKPVPLSPCGNCYQQNKRIKKVQTDCLFGTESAIVSKIVTVRRRVCAKSPSSKNRIHHSLGNRRG